MARARYAAIAHYYLIGVDGFSLRYETMRFLTPDIAGTDVADDPLPLPIRDVEPGRSLVFLVESGAPDALARRRAVARAYPGTPVIDHRNKLGLSLFTSQVVTARRAIERR